MRRAMSPERSALPFGKPESAGRETPSAAAAAVTGRPPGSMISVQMKFPRCAGFFTGVVHASALEIATLFKMSRLNLAPIILEKRVADFRFSESLRLFPGIMGKPSRVGVSELLYTPDMNFLFAFTGLSNIVGGLHPHERVHLDAKSLFNSQSHIP
jgi:hypothetical protein